MSIEGNGYTGDQSQSSGVCHRGGITHDQVYTDRQITRGAQRCPDSVVVNGDIYLGDDAPAAPQRRQTSRVDRNERYDRNDDRNLDSRYTEGATRYGDSYTGSSSRMAELERQNYYLQEQLRERQQQQTYQGFQGNQTYYEDPRYRGVNPQQALGAGIGGLIGMAIAGGHHDRYGYRHGNPGLGFLGGALIGGALTGGNSYDAQYMAPPPMIQPGWGAQPAYHYRHESPQQRIWEMRQEQRQRQMAYANYGNQGYTSYADNTYDTW